ncbi:MAG: FAD-dependent oxidoreductase [Actinobacteria bacterium]|nr:FAD-dependent oxidoreductase [Actinomycetota bacterium]MSW22922.1 FAD-dependent oxidoreductase [Actinomycetota bacterium]MSX04493.1 FAD-dependent oxidoreductase [Actinomycetota bacterium]MSX84429.1 FAD-dependent oxidoreductase [Actinomycetota bacterium]MSY96523.1 FAD-dependent oxidoreductase [Actinomycetota bacterium]
MANIDSSYLKHLSHMQPQLYWLDADPLEPEPHSTLIGETTTDLCIVGAGYTGLWTALLAKEKNPERKVIIIEQLETGAGASGRNGGFCSYSITHGFMNGYSRFKDEMAIIERLGRENLKGIEATIKKYKIDCGFELTGEISVANEEWQMEGIIEEANLRNSFGDNVEVLSREEMQARVNSPLSVGGLWDPDGTALVDPARLVWGLESACIASGVKIYENTSALRLYRTSTGMIVHTPYGKVFAQKVALATNVYQSLVRSAKKYVVPVYDFQLVTEPLTPAQMESIGWKNREGLSEAGNQFHYYRLTKDNEILWGGYDAIYNFRGKVRHEYESSAETYAHLAQAFLETFPQLQGIKFTHGWGGAIDTCSRFTQFWGQAHRGRVAYVMGYTGLGVGASRFGAQVMLDLLDGEDNERTRLSMVRKKPLPFPPEPFKFIFIRLTQWSINKSDMNQGKRNLWLKLLDSLGLGFDS